MNTYELMPNYDNCKSFYGKAIILDDGIRKELKSYETIVCTIENGKATIHQNAHKKALGNTSLRHIKEFLKQNDFAIGTKKELIERYGE